MITRIKILVEQPFRDGGTYGLQISYVYYKLESKVTSNFDVTSKKLGRFEKKKNL